jgi:hypothetical protein
VESTHSALRGIYENIVAGGIHVKIGDYFGLLKFRSVSGRNAYLDQRSTLSTLKKFEEILSFLRLPIRRTNELKSSELRIYDHPASGSLPVKSLGRDRYTPLLQGIKSRYWGTSLYDFYLSRYKNSFKRIMPPEYQETGMSLLIRKFNNNFSNEPHTIPIRQKIDQSVKKAATKYRLPPNLIKGVIKVESDFRARAVSSAGAQGLMQLMPGTAKELGIKDPFDIDQNIDGGSRYLRKMLGLFGGDLKLALAAYNAGPEAVKHYGGIPPYRETTLYVDRVLKFTRRVA